MVVETSLAAVPPVGGCAEHWSLLLLAFGDVASAGNNDPIQPGLRPAGLQLAGT